jgi:DNA-binding MarR family transcriptional regulator
MRDVRDAFLALAYLLRAEPASNQAVCVLVESRLSDGRLQEEIHSFRAVIHPEIAHRVHFLVDKGSSKNNKPAFSGSLQNAPSEFYEWLGEWVANEPLSGRAPRLAPRQLVAAALAQLRLHNQPPVTIKNLQETCGVSYPTVAAVLKGLAEKGMLEVSGERGVRLRHLTSGEWMELAREHAKQRRALLFTDPTGHASPEQLAKRLTRLRGKKPILRNARIGGVMGASNHFPELDIAAAPRLDLSAETDPAGVAAALDAGLVAKTRPDQRVALAVHLTRDPRAITHTSPEISPQWAGELECLADLIEMGFTREAAEMAHHMEVTNKEGRPYA